MMKDVRVFRTRKAARWYKKFKWQQYASLKATRAYAPEHRESNVNGCVWTLAVWDNVGPTGYLRLDGTIE